MLSVVENGLDPRAAIPVGDKGGPGVGEGVCRLAVSLGLLTLKQVHTVQKERPRVEKKL